MGYTEEGRLKDVEKIRKVMEALGIEHMSGHIREILITPGLIQYGVGDEEDPRTLPDGLFQRL